MANFTPGPWAAVEDINGEFSVVKQRVRYKGTEWEPHYCDASVVLSIGDHTDPETSLNSRENAFLIAAAPKMYAAMQDFIKRVDDGEIRSKNTYENFKSILLEARGEEEQVNG